MTDFRAHPTDPVSSESLAAQGLRLGTVETSDAAAFDAWLQADSRGFHGDILSPEILAAHRRGLGFRRITGVWDGAAAESSGDERTPVATVASWPVELALPGGAAPAWAISSVTVSPTHRRRGIARALLEAELRTATGLGLPLAILTVSEATLYGRYGFAPAAMAAEWRIDTRRVRWSGPATTGSLHPLSPPAFRAEVAELHERVRRDSPGEIEVWGMRWDDLAGLVGDGGGRAKRLRAVRFADEAGRTRGLALYRVSGGEEDFAQHTVTVDYLIAETVEAYAALWRHLLELDLVTEVVSPLRPVDEPLRWMIGDWRAATVRTHDHLWARALDVPAIFAARRYVGGPGRLAVDVTDPAGYAHGRWLLTVEAGGAGAAERVDEVPSGIASLALGVGELASLAFGGVSAVTLAGAGRLRELTPEAASAADALLRAARAPWLSVWF